MVGLMELMQNFTHHKTGRAGDKNLHVLTRVHSFCCSLANSSRTRRTSCAMVARLKSNRQPAASNSCGRGLEPPNLSAPLYFSSALALERRELAHTCNAPNWAMPYSM